MQQDQPQSRTVLEAGFRMIPGQEPEFMSVHEKMVPMGMAQRGFIAVYGGPILDSTWLYFGVHFETQQDMENWHLNQAHQSIQKRAYSKWWSAVYLRKWRKPVAGEAYGDNLMCETRLQAAAALSRQELDRVRQALSSLTDFGAQPFETVTGEHEPQPYQFAGPLDIAPTPDGATYTLITRWKSLSDIQRWKSSPSYQALCELGSAASTIFVPFVETGERDNMRADRLHRQWLKAGYPHPPSA